MENLQVVRAYKWDETMGRYRDADTGQFLSRDAVRGMVEKSIDSTQVVTDHLAGSVFEGTISPDAWRESMRGEIKREYIRQYLLANGGRYSMTPADWGRLGPMIREQYHYLDGFYEAVVNGDLSEAQIRARARAYINSAREAFHTAKTRRAVQYGMDEIHWVLGARGEHCGDCTNFADAGWQKIADTPFGGAHPGSGDTECLTSCGCFEEYRNSGNGQVY